MKLTINANSIYDRVIRIGRQTENLVSSITFNVQMWIEEYGAGECVLNVKRNGDGSAYPVPMTIADGMATWTITDTDTAKKGRGEIQLFYTVGAKVKTSPIFTISCGESLVGGKAPEPYEEWLTELNRMTAEVEAAKTSADQSAQTAQTAAGMAAEKATEAEQSANTASGFANNASASATSANASAQAASQSAEQAASSVSDVAAFAQAASASAQSAESAKTAAQTAEASAQGFAQTASEKAEEAAESAVQAQGSVTDAQAEVTRASAEADRAKTYADRAAEVELEIPTKVSELENDAGYLTEHQSLNDYVQKDVLYNMLPVDTASGSIASFPDGADDVPLKSLVVGINPVQDLHGYNHPWPAGGGKNLFDKNKPLIRGKLISDNGIIRNQNNYQYSDYYTPVEEKTSYIFSGTSLGSSGYNTISFYDESKTFIRRFVPPTSQSGANFTTPQNCAYIRFNMGVDTELSTLQLEKGSTATDYAPYSNICPISGWTGMTVNANGTEIPISWQSEAGTVYGGTLDVVSGVLTVTKGFIQSYNGETLPSAWISDRDVYAEGVTPTTGAEVCYDLAEPITYQLTPHEVKSLLGQNNIYADTGDTSVEYRADIQMWVEKKLGV